MVVLATAVAAAPASARPRPPDVTCEACVVVDETGRTLWARAQHAPRPNASTTKMVTALVTVRSVGLDEKVTVSPVAAATGGGGVDLVAGERYTVEALLHALLMTSSNDAAVALAEHVAGSEGAFVDQMNDLLEDLGAHDTAFVTSHGLDAPGHVASAIDLAIIGLEVLEEPPLARIVATAETTIQGGSRPVRLENTNPLLETYSGAVGIKTGMTSLAGEVLVAAARRDGFLVVAVAMGSTDVAADGRALLDFGFDAMAAATFPAAEAILVLRRSVADVVEDVAAAFYGREAA